MGEGLKNFPEGVELKGIEPYNVEWQKLPEKTPFKTEKIVEQTPEITSGMISRLEGELSDFGLGKVKVMKGAEAIGVAKDRKTRRALEESGSVIVDVGGIENLTEARPKKEQEFTSSQIAAVLVRDGVISIESDEDRVLKLGTSAAILEGGRGAELIEGQLIKKVEDEIRMGMATKAASRSEGGEVGTGRIVDDERVLLEQEFVVKRQNPKEGKAIYISIDVQGEGENNIDLVSLIDKSAQNIGLEHYTIRATITGPMKADVTVAKKLPEKRIESTNDIGELLVLDSQESDNEDNKFHFVGTRAPKTRRSRRFQELTGQEIYPGNKASHCHGYSEDGKMGGHLKNLRPQPGSEVEIILEPAEVVRVYDENREALK